MEILYGAKNGVHVFGYDSTESEPIWMKSGALWTHCWGAGPCTFGRDPLNSGSYRGSRNFLLGIYRTILPISRQTIFYDIWTQQRRSVRRWKLSEQNFGNFTVIGRFSKKNAKLFTKFPGLATSGRHNSTMITDRRKLTTKLTLYGMSSFHFYC